MSSIAGLPVDAANIANLKDHFITFNKITEACFTKCVQTLNYRTMIPQEETCVDSCSSKFINGNQRIMLTFTDIMAKRQQAMAQEAEANAQRAAGAEQH